MSCSIAIILIVEFKARPYHLEVDVNVLYEKILTKSIVQTSLMPNKMLTNQDLHDNHPSERSLLTKYSAVTVTTEKPLNSIK